MQKTEQRGQESPQLEEERNENLSQMDVTRIYELNRDAKHRIVMNEGGTRSSKTWSLAQLFVTKLHEEDGIVITICRKTLPSLKATAMKDFIDILKANGQYDEASHNKTDHIYRFRNSEVEFVSIDEPQKIRGRKRDYLWMNEANEFELEDFRQLALRTTKQIFMDFNPVDPYHWIVEEVMPRDDVYYINSTYKDNPFLEKEVVKEIERLKDADENYWRVFGLGMRAVSWTQIYTHWKLVDEWPANPDEVIYGIDFGFNNKTAVVRIAIKDGEYTWDELLYESGLTNRDLIKKLCEFRGQGLITSNMQGYADSAEPDRIEEIKKPGKDEEGKIIQGFNVVPADKSVKDGIDFVKAHPFRITKQSVNIQKEVKNYLWKTKDGKPIDEPVKLNDHTMDAGRYASYTHGKKKKEGRPRIRVI